MKWKYDDKHLGYILDNCHGVHAAHCTGWPSEFASDLCRAELFGKCGMHAETALRYRLVAEKALDLCVGFRLDGFILWQALERGAKSSNRLNLPWKYGADVAPDGLRLYDYEQLFAYLSDPNCQNQLPREWRQFVASLKIGSGDLGALSERVRDVRRTAGALVHWSRGTDSEKIDCAQGVLREALYGKMLAPDNGSYGLGFFRLLTSTFGVPPLSSEDRDR